jgi:hypothetical protein
MRGGSTAMVQQTTPGTPAGDWVLPWPEVARWLAAAQPRECLVYGRGQRLVRGETSTRLLEASLAGEVKLFQPRSREVAGFDYMAVKQEPKAAPPATPQSDPQLLEVLNALKGAAQHGRRCPSDAELARAVGLDKSQVQWRVRKLEHAGLISTELHILSGGARFRVVTIASTGWSTAAPEIVGQVRR